MPRQERFDGFEIDAHQARFAGTFDLDDDDLQTLELDRVLFMVVAVRVEGAGIKSTDNGDVKRVDVLKVQDCRVAQNDMREACVNWLMGKGGQQTLAFAERNGIATPEQKAEELGFAEQQALKAAETLEDVLEMEQAAPEPAPVAKSDGPKVAKFDPHAATDTKVTEIQTVGTVYDRKRKDAALTEFMQDF